MKLSSFFIGLLFFVPVYGQVALGTKLTPVTFEVPKLNIASRLLEIERYKNELRQQELYECMMTYSRIIWKDLEAYFSNKSEVPYVVKANFIKTNSSWIDYLGFIEYANRLSYVVMITADFKLYCYRMNYQDYLSWENASSHGEYYHLFIKPNTEYSIEMMCGAFDEETLKHLFHNYIPPKDTKPSHGTSSSFSINQQRTISTLQSEDNYSEYSSATPTNNYHSLINGVSTTVKSTGAFWASPRKEKELWQVSKGTEVKVLGYGNGFWKVHIDGIEGYLDNKTIYITFKMSDFIKQRGLSITY